MPAQRKVSSRQTEILLSFFESHRELAKGRVSQQGGPLGKQYNNNMWNNISQRLNCCGSGATKSAKEWKIYWNNIKYKVRTKATQIRRHMSGTASVSGKLTDEESRILAILGNESVLGESSVRSPFPGVEIEVPAASSSQEVLNKMEESEPPNAEGNVTIDSPALVPEDEAPSPAPVTPAIPLGAANLTQQATPATSSQQSSSSRPYDTRLPEILAWARETEDRNLAAQERTASALEELLVVQKEILRILKDRHGNL